MNALPYKSGWFQPRPPYGPYVTATLQSQHQWQNAITIRLQSGEPVITTWDRFPHTKPLTPTEEAELARRLALVEKVRSQLTTEPKKLGEVARAIGLTAAHLVSPLRHWKEFDFVKWEKGMVSL